MLKVKNEKTIQVSIHQEDVIPNTFMPNNRPEKYIRQKLTELKGDRDKSTIKGGGFRTGISAINSTTRKKIISDIKKFNNTINQQNLIDSLKHSNNSRIHFSNVHGTQTKISRLLLSHKTNLK